MKYEYEKPAPPTALDKAAESALSGANVEEQPKLHDGEAKIRGLTEAQAPVAEMKQGAVKEKETTLMNMRQEQIAGSAENAVPRDKTKREARSLTLGKAELTDVATPRFEDFPAPQIRIVKPSPVDLDSHPKARQFITMITMGAKEGPNFASHYTIAQWGCGTSCVAFAIIDAITGKVYFPPALSHVGWAGWWEKEYGLKFRVDSNLLKVYGSPNEQDEKGIFYYTWKDNKLELIKSDINK